MNEELGVRHAVTIDAMSLLERDAIDDSLEDQVMSSFTLTNMLRSLKEPLDKFVVLSIVYGFQKNEIGFMLRIHPSTVTRLHQDIQRKLRRFQDIASRPGAPIATPKNEDEAIINFFRTIFPNDPAIKKAK